MLDEHAILLEILGQTSEAESVRTLGSAYRYVQEVHAVRLRAIIQGESALGMCIGNVHWILRSKALNNTSG